MSRATSSSIGIVVLLALIAVIAAGCGGKSDTATPPKGADSAKQSIDVLVPCGQLGPFDEIKTLFEKANPGMKVVSDVTNIATMTQKTLDGEASPDVFMSMGDFEIDQLEQKGRVIPGTRVRYVDNSLALIVARDNPAKIRTLNDLTKPSVKKFAMVSPEVGTSGRHGKAALEKLGIWDELSKKTLTPDEPEMVAQYVGRGDAQAGIAYWPCMTEVHEPGSEPMPRKKVVVAQAIPQDLYEPFGCEAAVIRGAKNADMGREFIAFLQTPEAQKIFRKWNFIAPRPEPIPAGE